MSTRPDFSHERATRPDQADAGSGIGIAAGTKLFTLQGIVPVERVRAGDRIVSRRAGATRVAHVIVERSQGPLLWIAAGALGRGKPEEEILLPPSQNVLLRDGGDTSLVPAHSLVGREGIGWHMPERPIRLVTLVFDVPQVLYAGGLELESGVETMRAA
ncbi:Hint domain-containing protein [Roseicyclus sp. F158]|uniref:Hint domain-containing protein n=1 Tax=Tropicimonas omnivorans TaxID=3075590 RepID=A0ABU3DIP6_9RHOB|nr:Hint domain-containing protein [Roseicyclus sp. F158]MDT0683583.1 Hint domain-containing protein [Roseicyclus sp. F158]